jgi:UDP-N-acetylmuramoylalanine--D-glutamate ligase
MCVRFSELDGARVGVWGAGREIASFVDQLARRLPSAMIAVAAFDEAPPEDVRETLRAPDARIVTVGGDGGDEVIAALAACDVVVRSPGVSIHRPELRALREAGTPVTTATALWLAEHGGEGVIGVTGTKGKSTTAALACHLARAAGRTAALAGNIGVPALDLLDAEAADVTVLELSSFHIADLDTGPEVALVTSLFREHTDWHGSEEAYRTDKLRLLRLPGVRKVVINARDPGLAAALADANIAAGADIGLEDGRHAVGDHFDGEVEMVTYGVPGAWDAPDGGIALRGKPVASSDEMPLRGEHNALNLCGALTALEALGVSPPPLPASLRGFKPLAHRLETVAERDGVLWVNDSISTTPESTLAALASFVGREVVLIAGGQDRGQDYAQLGRAVAAGEVTAIGVPTTGPRMVAAAREAGAPASRAVEAADMREAVALARPLARPGGVILLSPAAPSYDNYRDFEQRGERFRALADIDSRSG